jgi:hypothetical protein
LKASPKEKRSKDQSLRRIEGDLPLQQRELLHREEAAEAKSAGRCRKERPTIDAERWRTGPAVRR